LGGVALELPGVPKGVPVAVAGHDHLSGAFAAGVIRPGQVFNSMGTAESFIGVIDERPLGEAEFSSGFTYGCHTVPGRLYWMGGLSASGGSVEWLRSVLGEPPLSYADLDALLARAPEGPTGILYFPYLAGSNSPHSDTRVRAAFVGLSASHGRAELLKAVLEGTAYELEYVRKTASQSTGISIDRLRIAGGGTRNRPWMQIKADVSGCRLDLLSMPETTLLGAALLAGIGAGVFGSPAEVFASPDLPGLKDAQVETVLPDPDRHLAYASLYRDGYLKLQIPLRSLGKVTGHS
jgi:xylulokinase